MNLVGKSFPLIRLSWIILMLAYSLYSSSKNILLSPLARNQGPVTSSLTMRSVVSHLLADLFQSRCEIPRSCLPLTWESL